MIKKHTERGRMRMAENVRYQLRDQDGNIKPMFAMNKLGVAVLKALRWGYQPYDEQGQLKPGLRSRLALSGLVIPGLTGSWVTEMELSNLVTDAGKAGVASRINGAGSEAAFTYIGVGVGTTAAAAGDTALQTEKLEDGTTSAAAHKSATASRVTTDVTNDTAQLVATFNFTATLAITESGVFNASSAGVLLCRQVFSAINVVSGDSLQVTWKIDVD